MKLGLRYQTTCGYEETVGFSPGQGAPPGVEVPSARLGMTDRSMRHYAR